MEGKLNFVFDMLSCIIIDDQKEAIDLLADHVSNTPPLDLLFTSTNPVEALNFLEREKVDLLFLDVQMPDMTGLEFVETLKEKWGAAVPKIIFTTGFDQYALSGFEYGVCDYLMKPVSYKRFKIAVDRILNSLTPPATEPTFDFFFADIDGKKVKITYNELVYIEGARNYIFIVTTQKKMITYRSMTAMVEQLPADRFLRVHKSYIVSIDKIQSLRGNEIGLKVNDVDRYIPVGITYRNEVWKKLKLG